MGKDFMVRQYLLCDSFYIVSYYKKWVTTSLTHSICQHINNYYLNRIIDNQFSDNGEMKILAVNHTGTVYCISEKSIFI